MALTPHRYIPSVLYCVLTVLSICFSSIVTSQSLPDEKIVAINIPEATLTSAIDALSEHTGVNITYSPQDIPSDIIVTIVANHNQLGLVLEDILSSTDLNYQIIGSQLVIFKDSIAVSDEKVRISGYVLDKKSGEKIVYANVYTDDYKTGTFTNEYGYFALDVTAGENVILFSYLGYDKTIRYFNIYTDTNISVTLNSNILLNEVVIIGEVPKEARQMEISDKIPIQKIHNLPTLAGEPDIIRLATLRPGVVTSSDGLGGISIRGGSIDQNLILYDGVPVYNTGHALGIFSIFNSTVVKSANIIKGGFPARYGGRLSSVLDVRTREGNNKEFAGDISISPITARATIEGPIKKEKSSFILSVRRTIVDPWLKPISKFQYELSDELGFINYYFYDVSAKVNMQMGKNDHFYFSGHFSKDKFSSQTTASNEANSQQIIESDRTNWNWGNDLGTLRWNHTFSNKIFSNVTLSYSKFNFEFFDFDKTIIGDPSMQNAIGYQASLFNSDITDIIANVDMEYKLTPKWNMAFGVNYTRHDFRPGVVYSSTRDDLLGDKEFLDPTDLSGTFTVPTIKGNELRAYMEQDFKITPWLQANIGGHFSYISVDDQSSFISIQPRALVNIRLNGENKLKISYTRMNQFLHLLTSAGIGLPNDVWVPSTSKIPPQESDQFSAELHFDVLKNTKFILSSYYKQMSHLRTFKDGAIFGIREGVDWEAELPEGEGRAYGIELSLEKQIGKYSGWINYSWAKSERTFDDLNDGNDFFANHDRRHNINFVSLFNLRENIEFSMQWTFGTGTPYTAPVSTSEVIIDDKVETTFIFGDRNNVRLPDYHRLDIGVNFFNDYGWGRQKITIGAYNVYNRKNPFYIDFVRDKTDSNQFVAEAVSIFPIVPNFSYSLTF
ncbi:MAG: TonB-dependent receptor [Saprospiraceae bacterium]